MKNGVLLAITLQPCFLLMMEFYSTGFMILHTVSFFVFLLVLPQSKLRHIVTSPSNMFLSPKDRPKGAMRDIGNLMEAEDIETVGAELIENFYLETTT